jgi:hypothetical protein
MVKDEAKKGRFGHEREKKALFYPISRRRSKGRKAVALGFVGRVTPRGLDRVMRGYANGHVRCSSTFCFFIYF